MASIHKHRSRWRVKWYDDTGRQLYESFATKAEAEAAARKVEARKVIDGKAPVASDPDALTLARWWDRWEPGRPWRPSSRAAHQSHWERWIKPVFGAVALDAIATADVAKFHRRLEARGLAPGTVGAIHRTLSMAMQCAVDDGLLARNPARYARLRRVPKHPPVALDVPTTDALLDAIAKTAPGLDVYARLVAATGMRRSEAAGLTWDRIDLDGRVITVDRQLDYSARSLPAWAPTKNNKQRRVVINDATAGLLRAHRTAQPVVVLDGTGLVFTRDDGRPWPRTTLNDAWRRAAALLDAAGTPLPAGARGWHTLRHTAVSRLLERGVAPQTIAEQVGDTVETLLSVYSHVTDRSAADDQLRAALDA